MKRKKVPQVGDLVTYRTAGRGKGAKTATGRVVAVHKAENRIDLDIAPPGVPPCRFRTLLSRII